jgi:hypothetical protein
MAGMVMCPLMSKVSKRKGTAQILSTGLANYENYVKAVGLKVKPKVLFFIASHSSNTSVRGVR